MIDFDIKVIELVVNTNFKEFFHLVVNCFEETSIDYVIVGGIPVIYYGRPRFTVDVDIIIRRQIKEIELLIQCLRDNGFNYGMEDIFITIEENSLATILHKEFPFKIDIQGISQNIGRNALKNRVKKQIFDTKESVAFIQIPEDLIIAKLIYAGDLTERNQDFEDAKGVLLNQINNINLDYLNKEAIKEGIKQKLDLLLVKVKRLID